MIEFNKFLVTKSNIVTKSTPTIRPYPDVPHL